MPRLIFSTFAHLVAVAIARSCSYIERASLALIAFVDRLFQVLAEPLRLNPVIDERPPRVIGIIEARSYATRLMARERRAQYLPLQASAI